MLLETTITKKENVQVEIKLPAYYKDSIFSKFAAICEDETLIYVFSGGYISKYRPGNLTYKSEIGDLIKGNWTPISESEFFKQYVEVSESFDMHLNTIDVNRKLETDPAVGPYATPANID